MQIKKRITFAIGVLTLASAAFATLQDAVKIAWAPKEGAVIKYKMTSVAKMNGGAMEGELHYDATVTHTYKAVTADSVTVEEKQSDVKVLFGDQDVSSQVPTVTTTEVMKLTGELIERKSDGPADAETPRVDQAFNFTYPTQPLKVNETWSKQYEADSKKNTFAASVTYTYTGTEKVGDWDCYKINSDYKETGAETNVTATGTQWLEIGTGELIKATYVLKNAPFAPAVPPMDVTATLTRLP